MAKSLDRRTFLSQSAALVAATVATPSLAGAAAPEFAPPKLKTKPGSAYDNRPPKLETVRVGFIGMGARGPSHLDACLNIDGVTVVAICDPHLPSANKGAKMVTDAGRPAPKLYTRGDEDFKRMLTEEKLDAVFIATPWKWHTPMAVAAMEAGTHALVEVPAALTVDECWQLVETAERTGRHCMMLENVNYGRDELLVLNMVREGVFGETLHGEAAYIHDLRGQMHEVGHGTGSWRTLEYAKRNGNLYPTHGLGPVAWYMDINRGDRFDYMSSVSSPSRSRQLYAATLPDSNPHKKLKYVCGDINTSIIKTVKGKTILVQWDEQLPRPYNRLNLLQGTKGVWGGFPNRCVIEGVTKSTHDWAEGEELKSFYDKYDHPLWKKLEALAKEHGGHGGMDFVMVWRVIYCLRNGLPLDQDVYDAAAWSVITPLSEASVKNRGRSYDIPDFTRGKFTTMKPIDLLN